MTISAEVFCAVVACLVYANTFRADFVYDDSRAILKNRDVLSTTPLPTIFFNDFWGTPMTHSGSHKSYRPFTVLSFRINHAISGFRPWSYHVTNVLLHALTTWLFVSFLRTRIFCGVHAQRGKSLIAGLLFAVHPIHTEAVAGVVGRADVLATLFVLSAVITYAGHCDRSESEVKRSALASLPEQSIGGTRSQEAGRRKLTFNKHKCRGKMKRKPVEKSNRNCSTHVCENVINDVIECGSMRCRAQKRNEKDLNQNLERTVSVMHQPGKLTNALSQSCSWSLYIPKCLSRSFNNVVSPCLPHILALCAMLSKEQGVCALFLCAVYDIWVRNKLGLRSALQAIFLGSNEDHLRRLRRRVWILFGSTLLLLALRILPWAWLSTEGQRVVVTPSFSESDNPTAACDSLLTRTLTFHYLLAFNAWLLLCPAVLSYDWSIEAIPPVESVMDLRNLSTALMYLAFVLTAKTVFGDLKSRDLTGPKSEPPATKVNSKRRTLQADNDKAPHSTCLDDATASDVVDLKNEKSQRISAFRFAPKLERLARFCGGESTDDPSFCASELAFDKRLTKYHLSLEEALGDIKTSSVCDVRLDQSVVSDGVTESSDFIDKYSEPTNSSGYATESSVEGLEDTCALEISMADLRRRSGGYKDNKFEHPSTQNGTEARECVPDMKLKRARDTDITIFGLALMIIPFLPATNLFFYVGFVVAERLLYLPSLGFCILATQGGFKLHRRIERIHNNKTKKGFCYAFKAAAAAILLCLTMRTLTRNADWQSEYNLYRSGISSSPAKSWANIGNILKIRGRNSEAEQAYLKALNHRSNMADVHYNLGLLYQEQKRYSAALRRYEFAIRFRPTLAVAYLNLGIVLAEIGKVEEAEKIYRHAARISDHGLKDPHAHAKAQVSALYNLGNLLASQNRHEDAVAAFEEAVRRRTADYETHSLFNMLGQSLYRLSRMNEAEKWFSLALRDKPDHVPAHLTYARLLSHTNRPEEAEQVYKKSLIIEPSNHVIYTHLSKFYADREKFTKAAEVMDEGMKTRSGPRDFEAVMTAANAHRFAKSYEKAEEYYRTTTRMKPNAQFVHMNLGAILHLRGKYEEARKSYLTALNLQPDDPTTLKNLAKLEETMRLKT